ncbi:phosphoribosylformylglycinamidine synthase, partial [Lacticaseibacillus rhamnosus]
MSYGQLPVRRSTSHQAHASDTRPSAARVLGELGGSCLAQTFGELGGAAPDVDDPQLLKRWFAAQRELRAAGLLLAYHDRSDGGLFTTLAEMACASKVGLDVELPAEAADAVAYLFNEELGVVVQVAAEELARVTKRLAEQRLPHHVIARP